MPSKRCVADLNNPNPVKQLPAPVAPARDWLLQHLPSLALRDCGFFVHARRSLSFQPERLGRMPGGGLGDSWTTESGSAVSGRWLERMRFARRRSNASPRLNCASLDSVPLQTASRIRGTSPASRWALIASTPCIRPGRGHLVHRSPPPSPACDPREDDDAIVWSGINREDRAIRRTRGAELSRARVVLVPVEGQVSAASLLSRRPGRS